MLNEASLGRRAEVNGAHPANAKNVPAARVSAEKESVTRGVSCGRAGHVSPREWRPGGTFPRQTPCPDELRNRSSDLEIAANLSASSPRERRNSRRHRDRHDF
jgi:hypothetical protein